MLCKKLIENLSQLRVFSVDIVLSPVMIACVENNSQQRKVDMQNKSFKDMRTQTPIGNRRFAYLMNGAGPASIATGLLVVGILTMMLALQ